MPRSQWKVELPLTIITKDGQDIAPRNIIIDQSCIGKTFYVHNGKGYTNVKIQERMVGRKFGEFALTRRIAKHQVKKVGKKKTKK